MAGEVLREKFSPVSHGKRLFSKSILGIDKK
jgi:hypothetical protein